ncbi:MAG: hypothetical protein PUC21_10060 [Bacteroidales bacterium]|nr:hypothetical protein [Bacteroidales bacterium]
MTREEEIYNQLVELFGAVDKQPKNFEVVMSKRQLNIAKEAEKRYLGRPLHQYYSAEDLAKAFRDGAEWADKNPTMRWKNHCVKINYPEQNKITMRVDFSNKEGGEE